MDKDYDENNYSIISNEDLQDMTDYSTSLLASSSLASPISTYHRNNNQYSHYSQQRMPASSHDLMGGMYAPQGSSAASQVTPESFKQYIDHLTVYLFKNDPSTLKYLEENISKCRNGDMELLDMGRTTPLLFPEMHALLKLDFPGLLYQLIPNALSQTGGIITITDEIYPKDYDFDLDDYPGPLTLEQTTEEQIFYYLKDQMSVELQDSCPVDWDSGHLLINYLELLIKENGKPRISNVVRLLNDGIETKTANLRKNYKVQDSISRNSFSRASSRATSVASSRAVSPENRDGADPELPQNSLDNPQGPGSVSSIMRRAVTNVSNDQKLYQNMDKYREYIFSGRFEEAVNFATRAGIWDHAFALALRMNNRDLVNDILVKFSRRAIYDNDPLFTMHELMAAKMPKVVATNRGFSSKSDSDMMGDWRSHLSMILAVKKFRPEESRQAIESMGEKLILLRSYFAAHLCFLLAGTPFGIDKTAHKYRRKFDLIGWPSSTSNIPTQKSTYATCHRSFSGFGYWRSAPEQYIKLTEVYEYVLRLRGDDSHRALAVHLVPYKYLMMYTMVSKQQMKSAYQYCRNIGEILGYKDVDWLNCESLTFRIITNMRDMSYKLHSLITRGEEENTFQGHHIQDQDDSAWLSNIDEVYCDFCHKYGLWNPRSMKPDSFLKKLINYSDEEFDRDECVSEQESQIQRDEPDNHLRNQSHKSMIRDSHPHQVPRTNQNYLTPQNEEQRPREPPTNSYDFQGLPSHSTFPTQMGTIKPESMINSSQNMVQFSRSHQVQPNQVQMNQVPTTKGLPQLPGKQTIVPGNFSEILPPLEIPKELIMTSPPQRGAIKTASGSSTERMVGNNVRYTSDLGASSHRGYNDFSKSYDYGTEKGGLQSLGMTSAMESHKVMNFQQYQPTLPQKRADSNYGALDGGTPHHLQNPRTESNELASKSFQMQATMFMPTATDDVQGSNETIDCFAHAPSYSRSRSQSNGSVGSGDNQLKTLSRQPPVSRSRNSSESKEANNTKIVGHLNTRPLETTKEEVEQQRQERPKPPGVVGGPGADLSSGEKKAGWNPLNWLTSKTKGIHLPDDDAKSLEYDSVNNKWIDKSNPETEKPPTPPPKMPLSSHHEGGSFNNPPASNYQGPTSPILQRYRLATPNVRPSLNVPSTALPFIPSPMTMNHPSHYDNNQSFDGRRQSQEVSNQLYSNQYNNQQQQMNNYGTQPAFNQPYESSNLHYQENYNIRAND